METKKSRNWSVPESVDNEVKALEERFGQKKKWTFFTSAMLLFLSIPDEEQERLASQVSVADERGRMGELIRQAKERARALSGDPDAPPLIEGEALNDLLDRLWTAKARRDARPSQRRGGRKPG